MVMFLRYVENFFPFPFLPVGVDIINQVFSHFRAEAPFSSDQAYLLFPGVSY